MRQHHTDRLTMHDIKMRRERVCQRMRHAKHAVFDRDTGIRRTEKHA
jgi:hypothetical protein